MNPKRLFSRHGESATLTRVSSSTFDPVTGTESAAVLSKYTATVIYSKYKTSAIDGTNILRDDLNLSIYNSEKEPEIGDKIKLGDYVYSIVNTENIKSKDKIYTAAQARK